MTTQAPPALTGNRAAPRRRSRLAGKAVLALALALASSLGCGFGYDKGTADWVPPDYWETERYAEVAGLRLCYLESGPLDPDAAAAEPVPTIVFVHGWSGNLQNWWDQYEYFRQRYRVVVFDLPGHGKSERGPHIEHTMDLYDQALLELLDTLEIERAIIAGNSAGGWIATRFALDHPGRVERLILADPTGTRFRGKIGTILPILNARRLHMVGMTDGKHYPAVDPKSLERRAFIESFNGTAELKIYLETLAEVLPQTYVRLDGRFSELEAPTLLLWGDDDPVVPKRARKVYEREVDDLTTYLVQLGGHAPMMASPAEVTCAMDAFLNGRALEPCTRYAIDETIAKKREAGEPVALPRYP